MEIADKVVVVTGGCSGIGAGLARRFRDARALWSWRICAWRACLRVRRRIHATSRAKATWPRSSRAFWPITGKSISSARTPAS